MSATRDALTSMIEEIVEDRARNEPVTSDSVHQRILECLKVLPPKSYGDTTMNDNSNAILGDVYQFFNSNSDGEQQNILQDLQKRVERLCQRQDERDAQIGQLCDLLKQSKLPKESIEDTEQSSFLISLVTRAKSERQPVEILQECESVAVARQYLPDLCSDKRSYFAELDNWICTRGSTLLLVQAELLAADATKDSAAIVAHNLRNAAFPIIWYLPDPSFSEQSLDVSTVLRSLTYQLVGSGQQYMSTTIESSRKYVHHDTISEEELISLFRSVLAKLPCCFLIVDFASQRLPSPIDEGSTQRLADIFTAAIREAQSQARVLRILMVHSNPIPMTLQSDPEHGVVRECAIFATPMPLARSRYEAIRADQELSAILDKASLTA